MTIKDAVLKAIEEIGRPAGSIEISKYIQENKLYVFDGLTPDATISAQMGDFIRKNDTRVSRIKEGRSFIYFLAKNQVSEAQPTQEQKYEPKKPSKADFSERDLHPLFVSYLNSINIYAKTILHEESKNSRDETQKWAHPDIVGVKFARLKNEASIKLLKTLEKKDSCDIYSYELKKEINSDYELKKSYFQAVSNSSWANYGYLVAFEISDNLKEEMERLSRAFGIGVIKLHANPFESQVLFAATHKELDYQTIDKLCNINDKYHEFIGQIEKILNADDKYHELSMGELERKCDPFYTTDEDVINYCQSKNITSEE